MKTKEFSSLSLMEVKAKLMNYKKRGIVFFNEDISTLLPKQPFHLLYFWLPGHSSLQEAFPVPIKHFQSFKFEMEQTSYLKDYFETFYETSISDEKFGHTYDLFHPFVGTEYVWYLKRIG
jgi:hypothetical protein